jgi:hypothetical protein
MHATQTPQMMMQSAPGAPPSYVRDTLQVSLVEAFSGLHVQPAPQYEPPITPFIPTSSSSDTQPPRILQRTYVPRGTLAERCAASYFSYALKRHYAPALSHLIQDYHADLSQSRVRRALTLNQPSWRGARLRMLVNATIDTVVVPELQRRAEFAQRVQGVSVATDQETQRRARQAMLKMQDKAEYDRVALFGDLWTGAKEQGVDVTTMHQDMYTRLQLKSSEIVGKMKTAQHEQDFALLQTRCLTRMQESWHTLMKHCAIQLDLVRERGRNGGDMIAELMAYEQHRMEQALQMVKEEFEPCVLHKTERFPPLMSFYGTFAPLFGNALHAARQVYGKDARNCVYNADFLNRNRLFEHASRFFSHAKDHLQCLMILGGLKRKRYLADRKQERLQHQEAERFRKEQEKDAYHAPAESYADHASSSRTKPS